MTNKSDHSPSSAHIVQWLVTAFMTGAVIMILEMTAFRLYAPFFGYSIYVWGNMISVVMAALALGYALGGCLADRRNNDHILYATILAAAFYQLLVIWGVWTLLPALSQLGELSGTTLATVIIFAPPMIALASVSPYLIRLMARIGHVGLAAGSVYSLATVGSIAGIALTTFVLLPNLGTQKTLMVACATTGLVAVAGLVRSWRASPMCLLALVSFGFAPVPCWNNDTVWVGESEYNLIRVIRRGSRLALVLNDESWIQTMHDEDRLWTYRVWDDYSLGPLLVDTKNVLILGMGAGGSVHATFVSAPHANIDAVEIDPKVVEAGKSLFGLDTYGEKLAIHTSDARRWISQCPQRYEIVHVDLYQGGPYIPFYLATEEFFQSVEKRMVDEGLLMMNVIDKGPDYDLLLSIGATLKRVFSSLAVLSKESGNHMLFAFKEPRSAEWIRARLRDANAPNSMRELIASASPAIIDLYPPDEAKVFTDDHAPIEAMTRRMLRQSTE